MEFRERPATISFEEAERRYADLKRRHDAGQIDEEEFDAERQRLLVRDDEGRWWAKSRENGRWHYNDSGGAWIAATPPVFHGRVGFEDSPERTDQYSPERPRQRPTAQRPESRRSGLLIGLGVLCTVLAVGLIVALAYPLLTGKEIMGVTLSGSSPATPPRPAPPPGANVDRFVGLWANENPQTEGITRVEITSRLGDLHVQMWGSCEPTDCNWGTQSTDVSDSDDGTLSITWRPGFKVEAQELTVLSDGRLQVVSHTHFTDDSGRPDYDSTHYFRRTTGEAEFATPPPESTLSSGESAVEAAIRSHYEAIGAGNFEEAYSYFGPTFRNQVDQGSWVSSEESYQITGSTVNSLDVTYVDDTTATADVDVSFTDKTGTPRFLITWRLVKENGQWKLDDQVSGKSIG
jgi:hypothetical protein